MSKEEEHSPKWHYRLARNPNALLFGLFVAFSSILDWCLNAPLRYKPYTEQELQLYLDFRVLPKRVMAPPEFTIEGIMHVLAIAFGYFLLGIILFRFLKVIECEHHEATVVYLRIAKISALLLGGCASFVCIYAAYKLPMVMKLFTATIIGVSTFIGTDIILSLPYRIFQLRGKMVN
jgi:hypothetical protein